MVEQWVRTELKNTELREKLDNLGKTAREVYNQELKKQSLKLNVNSGKTFSMTREGTKLMSIISVGCHPVVKITAVHLDFYADYLRQKDPKLDRDSWTETKETRSTLHRRLWPISSFDECGRRKALHDSSRDGCK